MVNNFVCKDCKKSIVCEWYKTIEKKFDVDSKNAYGMEITINECYEFDEVVLDEE